MQSNCGLFNRVIISWTTNIQTSNAADPADAKLRGLHRTIKHIGSFSHFLFSSDIKQATTYPVTLYAYNNATINTIIQNKISSRFKHLDIPVPYSNEKLVKKYFTLHHINTKLNAADYQQKRHQVLCMQDIGTSSVEYAFIHHHLLHIWNIFILLRGLLQMFRSIKERKSLN